MCTSIASPSKSNFCACDEYLGITAFIASSNFSIVEVILLMAFSEPPSSYNLSRLTTRLSIVLLTLSIISDKPSIPTGTPGAINAFSARGLPFSSINCPLLINLGL